MLSMPFGKIAIFVRRNRNYKFVPDLYDEVILFKVDWLTNTFFIAHNEFLHDISVFKSV